MTFSPENVEAFSFDGWEYDARTARLSLHYRLLPKWSFTETIIFNGAEGVTPGPAGEKAFDLINQLAGVSYFKAAIPAGIRISSAISEFRAQFLSRTYANGLGELAYRNGCVDRLSGIRFDASEATEVSYRLETPGIVVPIGGGKDSLVTADLLARSGHEFRTISIGNSRRIAEVVNVLGTDHIRIDRRLDSRLFELNSQGAINGHVPISAILASIMTAAASLYGYDTIVMSNERSAEEPNVIANGISINHQYSKSLAFERDFSAIVRNEVAADLCYFSALRPYSELAIARRFSTLTQFHSVFSSCNSNFRLHDPALDRWCAQCPKCRFVFLALAPFMEQHALVEIFGSNLLDQEPQRSGYEELLGIHGHKPFECVGEIAECKAAWNLLCANPEWSGTRLLHSIGPVAGAAEDWQAVGPDHAIPDDFANIIGKSL